MAKTEKTPIVQAEPPAPPTRCPACKSTKRSEYRSTSTQEYAGLDDKGRPYTHIVRRWCNCMDCGQSRIDRVYENRTEK
jgi:hypothetical protein